MLPLSYWLRIFMINAMLLTVGFETRLATASILIVNPGFESPTDSQGDGVGGGPTGWDFTGGGAGVWNISSSPFWTVPAPEGNQVGYVAEPGAGSATMSQVLAATLQANTIYSLIGQVGQPIGFASPNGVDTIYTVELFAGTNFLASTSGTGPEGSFAPFLVSFDSTGSAHIGQSLQIRLSSSQAQTAFDAIALEDSPIAGVVPEAASFVIWGVFGLTYAAGAWHRRRNDGVRANCN